MRPNDPNFKMIYETTDLNLAAALLCYSEFRLDGSKRGDGGFVVFCIEGDCRLLEAMQRNWEKRETELNVHEFLDQRNHLTRLIRGSRGVMPHHKTRKENTDHVRQDEQRNAA